MPVATTESFFLLHASLTKSETDVRLCSCAHVRLSIIKSVNGVGNVLNGEDEVGQSCVCSVGCPSLLFLILLLVRYVGPLRRSVSGKLFDHVRVIVDGI